MSYILEPYQLDGLPRLLLHKVQAVQSFGMVIAIELSKIDALDTTKWEPGDISKIRDLILKLDSLCDMLEPEDLVDPKTGLVALNIGLSGIPGLISMYHEAQNSEDENEQLMKPLSDTGEYRKLDSRLNAAIEAAQKKEQSKEG